MTKPKIMIVNASRGGAEGNTAEVLRLAGEALKTRAAVTMVVLADTDSEQVLKEIEKTEGLVFGTGTYWDSWSHYLQRFLEEATATEGTATWLGKPTAVFVTGHSEGGKGVLSRLQGVLATFGCLIPPMGGMVYSLANQQAIARGGEETEDLWSLADIDVVCRNLCEAMKLSKRAGWESWPVDRAGFAKLWIKVEPV
jgi:chromate reductase